MSSDRKLEMMKMRLEGLTYQKIGKKFGLSRQRIQQLCRAPRDIREIVVKKAKGKCRRCGMLVGLSGDIHHTGNGAQVENYNDVENLVLLCRSCHYQVHQGLSVGLKEEELHDSPRIRQQIKVQRKLEVRRNEKQGIRSHDSRGRSRDNQGNYDRL